jgi:hypothetical protein
MKIIRDIPEKRSGLEWDLQYLQERFDPLLDFDGIKVYDSEHSEERFKERFPGLSLDRFYDTLKKGLRKINSKWDYQENFYVIISNKYDIKIPIEIRPDRKNPEILIGIIATVLNSKKHPFNKYNEIQLMVEESKRDKSFHHIKEHEELEKGIGFTHYLDEGEYFRDFVYIEV